MIIILLALILIAVLFNSKEGKLFLASITGVAIILTIIGIVGFAILGIIAEIKVYSDKNSQSTTTQDDFVDVSQMNW